MIKSIAFILLILPIALMGQKGDYILKGKVGTLGAPAKIYLSLGSFGTKPDSVTLTNGQFEFRGTLNSPKTVALILSQTGTYKPMEKPDRLSLFLEPGTITVVAADSISRGEITGSKINDDNKRLKIALEPTDKVRAAIVAEYNSKSDEEKKNEAFLADLIKRNTANEDAQKQVAVNFIKANPNSYVSLVSLSKRVAGSVPEYSVVEPLFKGLSDEVKNTEAGIAFASLLEKVKATALNEIAPDFTQNDPEGNPVKLSDFKGKYVLIDFWASWCGPCRKENPNVVKAYSKFHDKGFEILGVSLDQKKEAWIKAIADDHLTWKHVSDLKSWNNAVAVQYGVRAVPQNFLLDPNGKIIAKNLRGEEMEAKLSEIFK